MWLSASVLQKWAVGPRGPSVKDEFGRVRQQVLLCPQDIGQGTAPSTVGTPGPHPARWWAQGRGRSLHLHQSTGASLEEVSASLRDPKTGCAKPPHLLPLCQPGTWLRAPSSHAGCQDTALPWPPTRALFQWHVQIVFNRLTSPCLRPGTVCAPWAGTGVSHPYKSTGGEHEG